MRAIRYTTPEGAEAEYEPGSCVEKDRYLRPVKQGYIKNYRPLAAFFTEVIERGRVTP
jgi:hypothetical protein